MTIETWMREAFEKAFPGGDFSQVSVLPATDPRFGDFQCNDALKFAKALHMPPRKIAEAALEAGGKPDFLEKAEIAGPGFINLTVSSGFLAGELERLDQDPDLGIAQVGAGRTVVIDYSSPNAAKQMHIGHIRSTVIGNAIDRIYRSLGYRVIADNHLGDWGTQFGILIKGYRECLTDEERANLSVPYLERAYVESSSRAKTDEEWKKACREELVKLQRGDEEDMALWRRFIEISIEEFNRIYAELGVKFDTYRGESYYNGMMAPIVDELVEKGLAEPSEGALIVRFEKEGLPIAIVRKSDGGFNYTTSDIACVRSRIEDYSPDEIIYVTDDRQQLHFRQFFIICAKLGMDVKLTHVPFGLMSFAGKAISTREGNLIRLDELLSEAKRRALEIVMARKGGEEPQDEDRRLASSIGIGAVKYADLSHDPATPIDFDWDKALALDGNSGPYLQYAYARVCSLLDKAAEGGAALDGSFAVWEPQEKLLALALLQFGQAVKRAAECHKPSILADCLYQTSQLYSSFYQRSPVLRSAGDVRAARLRLCALFGKVLSKGLSLLGIDTPRRI